MTAPATMYDVAALAGVSHQTVSRVVNERAGVSSRTRATVLASIAALEFRANPAAVAMGRRNGGDHRSMGFCPTCGGERQR